MGAGGSHLHRLAVVFLHQGAPGHSQLLGGLDSPEGGEAHEDNEKGNGGAAGDEEACIAHVAAAAGAKSEHSSLDLAAAQLVVVVRVKLLGHLARGWGEVTQLDAGAATR